MRVTWVTFLGLRPAAAYKPILCGNVPSPSNWTYVDAKTEKFLEGDEYYNHYQYIHTSVFSNLKPECWYEYQVSNFGIWSKTYIFSGRTPDTENTFNDANNPLTMIIFGDWGTGPIGQYTKHLLGEETLIRDYLGIIHMGDLAYNMNDENGKVGDDYLRMIEPIAATIPYMTAPGNHESYHNYSHYKARLNMPYNDANQGTSYFYSLNLGPVHFIIYNSNAYFKESSQIEANVQTRWLVEDLAQANVNRELRPWIVVLAHHPLYCSQD